MAAIPLLYHTMTSPNPSTHLAFLTTLCTQPHLAPLVRIYHLPSQVQELATMAYTVREKFWNTMRLALPAMVNLKELVIPKKFSMSSAHRFLPALTSFPALFSLDKLVWLSFSFHRTAEDGQGTIQSVLSAQPNLRYFKWGSPIFPTGSSSIIFPQNLTCLGGPTLFLIHVLPHTPSVRCVSWNTKHTQSLMTGSPMPVQIQQLMELEEFKRLRTLRIEGGSENGALFEMYEMFKSGRGRGVDVEVLVFPGCYPLRDTSLLSPFPRLSELIIVTETETEPEPELAELQTLFITLTPSTTATNTDSQPVPLPPTMPLSTLNRWVGNVFRKHCGMVSVDVRVELVQEDDGSKGEGEKDCYRRWVKGELMDGHFLLGKEFLLDY